MKRTPLRVFFTREEQNEIIKMVNEDQDWLVKEENYNKRIEELREQIKKIEEERSIERTKVIRRKQSKFVELCKEHKYAITKGITFNE